MAATTSLGEGADPFKGSGNIIPPVRGGIAHLAAAPPPVIAL